MKKVFLLLVCILLLFIASIFLIRYLNRDRYVANPVQLQDRIMEVIYSETPISEDTLYLVVRELYFRCGNEPQPFYGPIDLMRDILYPYYHFKYDYTKTYDYSNGNIVQIASRHKNSLLLDIPGVEIDTTEVHRLLKLDYQMAHARRIDIKVSKFVFNEYGQLNTEVVKKFPLYKKNEDWYR